MAIPKLKPAEIEYPESDGKPMAESDVHRDWMMLIIERLKNHFAGRRVYVSGNLLIYYEEGNPRRSVAPDTFVVKNCNPRRRRIFKIWEEKKGPNFILETTSKSTRAEDRTQKRLLYAKLRVPEYFLYDPLGEWLRPPLQGFRLKGDDYEPILADAEGGLVSQELGIRFVLRDGELVMFDLATGREVLTRAEQAAQDAEGRAQQAEQRLKELQDELARLRSPGKKTNGSRRKNG